MISCSRHGSVEADYHCPLCEKAFCASCVKHRKMGHESVAICPLCDNVAQNLAPYKPRPPFWRDLRTIARYPFEGIGLVILAAWPLYGLFVRGAPIVIADGQHLFGKTTTGPETVMVFFMHAIFYLLYVMVSLPLFHHTVKSAVFGDFGMSKVSMDATLTDLLLTPSRDVFGPVIAVMWPHLILYFLAWQNYLNHNFVYLSIILVIAALNLLFAVFILPMSFLCMSAFHNLALIFDLRKLVGAILKIKREYFIFTMIVYAAMAVYILFVLAWMKTIGMGSASATAIFLLVDSLIHIYLLLFFGQMLGTMAYQTRFKLKWWGDTRETLPDLNIDGKVIRFEAIAGKAVPLPAPPASKNPSSMPAVDRDISMTSPLGDEASQERDTLIEEARYLLEHGSYQEAAGLFRQVLQKEPRHFSALNGLLTASFKLDDRETILEQGKVMGSELNRQHAHEAMWDMYQDYKSYLPEFTFDAPELDRLARWLVGSGKKLEAARLLRELAIIYPAHDAAPPALLTCAELLAELGMSDKAKNVLAAIKAKYPDSDAAAQAQAMTERLE